MIQAVFRIVLRGLAVGGLCLCGCTSKQYQIELRPTDDGLERKLTCRSSSSAGDGANNFPAGELREIAALYDAKPGEANAEEHTFAKTFSTAMPADVGGSGSYRRWETTLGSLSIYIERFRGDDDWLTEIETRGAAVDRIVDLMLGWLTTELEGEAGFDQLREFIDTEFRRDLSNLCLYSFVGELLPEQEEMTAQTVELAIRIGHYFVERSYFSLEEIPEITRAFQESQATGHPQRVLKFVQRMIAKRMGAEDHLPRCLNFLGHELALKKSVDSYLSSTDEYRRILDQWQREAGESPGAEKPEPAAVLVDNVRRAFLPALLNASDSLDVTLAANTQPMVTNGVWDGGKHEIRWQRSLAGRNDESFSKPSFLFALWSEPNRQTQQDLFGKTIIEGHRLGQYCLWHQGLNKSEAQQWDEFLSNVSPGDSTLRELNEFRFAHEPPPVADDNGDGDLAATARDLIRAGLDTQQ